MRNCMRSARGVVHDRDTAHSQLVLYLVLLMLRGFLLGSFVWLGSLSAAARSPRPQAQPEKTGHVSACRPRECGARGLPLRRTRATRSSRAMLVTATPHLHMLVVMLSPETIPCLLSALRLAGIISSCLGDARGAADCTLPEGCCRGCRL